MKLWMLPVLAISHAGVLIVGFALGVYFLPILVAPPAPSEAEVQSLSAEAQFTTEFKKDLTGSDAFHWGVGKVSVSEAMVSLQGSLAPGPDYFLYFSPEFVETEADFERLKPKMKRAGAIKTFDNFLVAVPGDINIKEFTSVIVWCESFGEFITAAQYKN